MKKIKKNKPVFLYGLGEKKSNYKSLESHFTIPKIDWNTGKILPVINKKADTLIGFSLGGTLACQHALKHRIKNLILCSLTPGAETLERVNAGRVIFLVGEQEKWVLKDLKRMKKTLRCQSLIIIVPNAGHSLKGRYRQKLLEVVKNLI